MLTRFVIIVLLLGAGGLVLLNTCSSPSERKEKFLREAQSDRETKAKRLHAMDPASLVNELQTDSKDGIEPFNSMAFSILISQGDQAAPHLATAIKKSPDRNSLLTLLVLRKVSPEGQYKALGADMRVKVLIDALRQSRTFNTWGLPHAKWQEAAKAIIEEGRAARAPLVTLLTDKREAPVWGSAIHVESLRYGYRVNDYAWALLNKINAEDVEVPKDRAKRDALIQDLINRGGMPRSPAAPSGLGISVQPAIPASPE